MSNTNIYVLKLEHGKYYVGKSDDVMKRYQQHLCGNGSAWTRRYKPISFEKTIECVSSFEEDKITKEYMSKYGIENVRGGSYVEIELDDTQKESLQREIWGAKDLCARCGRSGHFVKNCYSKTDIHGNKIEYESESDESVEWCCEYCDRTFTTEFGASVHEKSCKEKNKKNNYSNTRSITCYRCGNKGHYSSECYASRHVKGYYLDE